MGVIQARDIASDDFVLVEADWSLRQARDVIDQLLPAAIIVHRIDDDEDYYYLEERADFLGFDPAASVRDALQLHEWQAAPVVDHLAPISADANPMVVVSDDRVLGFTDAGGPPAPPIPDPPSVGDVVRGGGTRGGGGGTRGGGDVFRGGGTRGGGGGGEATEARTVVRHLEVNHPERATVGDEIDILVQMAGEGFAGDDIAASITAEVGDSVDVIISTKSGVELAGPSKHRLTVDEDGAPVICQFKLHAIEVGTAHVQVLAFIDGQSVGVIPIGIQIEPSGSTVTRRSMRRRADVEAADRRQPDLTLLIYEQLVDGLPTLQFILNGRDPSLDLNMAAFTDVQLRTDPSSYFGEYFGDIEQWIAGRMSGDELAPRMRAKGASLYEEVVPPDLRDTLWRVRDRIESVLIQSTDPWIPWEMCFVSGEDDGEIVDAGYLCELYAVSRWVQGNPLRPALSLANIGLVVTGDSGLPMARQERQQVLDLAGNGRAVNEVPADYVQLTAALASGTLTSLHFTGHGLFADGADPDRSFIQLRGHTSFTATDISGKVRNLGKAVPFVFINACQVGRGDMTLAGAGGWAASLLDAGAGAFLGSHWSVRDNSAVRFSEVLYERLLDGDTLPAAVRAARLAIKSDGDPTWLAYALYADPFARVS